MSITVAELKQHGIRQEKEMMDIGVNLSAARDIFLEAAYESLPESKDSFILKLLPIKLFFILSIVSLYTLAFISIPAFKLNSLIVIPSIALLYYIYYRLEGLQKLGIGWIAHFTIAGFILASIEYAITFNVFHSIFFALLPLPFLFVHLMYFYIMTRAFFLLSHNKPYEDNLSEGVFIFKYNDGTYVNSGTGQEIQKMTLSHYVFSDLEIQKRFKPSFSKLIKYCVCILWIIFLSFMTLRFIYAKTLPYVPLSGDISLKVTFTCNSDSDSLKGYKLYGEAKKHPISEGENLKIKTKFDDELNLYVYLNRGSNRLVDCNSIAIPVNELDLTKANHFNTKLHIGRKLVNTSFSIKRSISPSDVYRAFLNK